MDHQKETPFGRSCKYMNSKEALEKEIEQLEAQLKPRKAALRALKELEAMAEGNKDSPATKYFNMRPLDAIRSVLEEHGKPMPKDELSQILLDGGIAIGKKRAEHNVNVSIKVNVRTKNLTSTGKDELIGLPEWASKK